MASVRASRSSARAGGRVDAAAAGETASPARGAAMRARAPRTGRRRRSTGGGGPSRGPGARPRCPRAAKPRRPSRAIATAAMGPGSAPGDARSLVATSSIATSSVPVATSATRAWAAPPQRGEEHGAARRGGARGQVRPLAAGVPPPALAAQRCSPLELALMRSRTGSSSPAAIAACTAHPGSLSWRQSENRQPAASACTSAKAAATPTGSAPMRGRRRPGVSISRPPPSGSSNSARCDVAWRPRSSKARISAVAW